MDDALVRVEQGSSVGRRNHATRGRAKDSYHQRADHGLGSTMYRMQYQLPLTRVSGDAGFGVTVVYEVTEKAHKARQEEQRREEEYKKQARGTAYTPVFGP